MRKIGIITALLCLAAAAAFLLWPRAQDPPEQKELTVTDSTGRTVTLPSHPERVVILNPSNLDLYVAAGGAENIVGKPTSQTLSETVKEKTAAAEEVGIIHQPDIEKILALQPDLVIGTNVPFHTGLEGVVVSLVRREETATPMPAFRSIFRRSMTCLPCSEHSSSTAGSREMRRLPAHRPHRYRRNSMP